MPSKLKTWATQTDPKRLEMSRQAHMALASLPPSETKHGTQVPFPFVDRKGYKDYFSNKQINKRIKTAPVVDMPLEGLVSVQHSVKPELVSYYIDHPDVGNIHGQVHPKTGTPTDIPIILQFGGQRWIYDGNHRTTAAMLRGEKTIQARFVNFDSDAPTPQGSFSASASGNADTASKTSSSSSSS